MRAETPTIIRISTGEVAPRDRLEYWSSILSSSFAPISVDYVNQRECESELRILKVGSMTFAAQGGSAQRGIRGRAEIRRTTEHCFNLVLVLNGLWDVTHGRRIRFGPGELIFHDSRYPLEFDLPRNHSDLNLQLSEAFVRKWVPNPAWLLGRRISADSQWGRVLTSYVAQLSPEFVAQAPLPQSVLLDQVGALLALVATELRGERAMGTRADRSVRDQVHDQIRQRCTEISLQAADIGSSLGISTRTLHRALAACGETFGAKLIEARVDVAARLLQSPLFAHITTAEIGRRAGFSDASHFTKVLRRHTGQTPLQMRRARQA